MAKKEMSKQKNLSVYRQSLEAIKRGQDLLGWKTQLLSSPVCWLAKYSPKIMSSDTVNLIKGVNVKSFANPSKRIMEGSAGPSQLNERPSTVLKELSHSSLIHPK